LILIFFTDVIRTGNGGQGTSLLKSNVSLKNTGSQNAIAYSSDDDLEIIEVKQAPPPVSLLNKSKYTPRPGIGTIQGGGGGAQSLAQAQAFAAARQKLSLLGGSSMMAGLSSASLLGNPLSASGLGGQGDFGLHAAAAGLFKDTTNNATLDILQKCKISLLSIFFFLAFCLIVPSRMTLTF
jgi:hypothetical protein